MSKFCRQRRNGWRFNAAAASSQPPSLHLEKLEPRLALAATVSGIIFLDANRNGVRDDPTSEPGVANVSVGWTGGFDNPNIGSVTSGASGQYSLPGVDDDDTGGIAAIAAVAGANREVTSPLRSSAGASSVDPDAGTRPTWVAVGRLNADPSIDLVAANTGSGNLTLYFNQNGAAFTTATVTVGTQPSVVLVEDFNKDGFNDLAVGHKGSAFVTLLINNGHGGFATQAPPLPASAAVPSLDAADVDGDGDLDLIGVTSELTPKLLVWRNDSNGAAAVMTPLPPADVRQGAAMIVAAKLDPAGPPDLLVLNVATNAVYRHSNNGAGGFVEDGQVGLDAGGPGLVGNPNFIAVGDLNGDGLDDLAVSRYRDQKISLRFNAGGQFSAAGGVDVFAVWHPIGLTIADVDRDGDADVVVNTTNSPAGVVENLGGQSFADAGPFGQNVVADAFMLLGPTAVADFNNDGILDFAYSNYPFSDPSVDVDFNRVGAGAHIVRTAADSGGRDFGVAPIVLIPSTEGGDYNGDDATDRLDLAVWKANYGATAGPGLSADGNRNGDVEGGDFLLWQRRVGAGATAAGRASNEPPPADSSNAPAGDRQRFNTLWRADDSQSHVGSLKSVEVLERKMADDAARAATGDRAGDRLRGWPNAAPSATMVGVAPRRRLTSNDGPPRNDAGLERAVDEVFDESGR